MTRIIPSKQTFTYGEKMIKACIFDLDGTLTNTLPTISHYGNGALEKNGFLPFDEERYKYFVGNGAKTLVERMLRAQERLSEENFARVFEDYSNAYDKAPLYLTAVYEGILPLLSALKERGIKTAVLSNKPDFATRSVVEHFFPSLFNVAHGAREGIPLKPSPDSALALMVELGISNPAEILYVGDTSVDMDTGKAAGFYTVGVLWGFREREELAAHGADAIVSHPSGILDLIEG